MPAMRAEIPRVDAPRIVLACLLAAFVVHGAMAAPPPVRIVSINICGDLLALTLAPPERIASVTFLAADPNTSPLADRAQGVALNYGKAEEVLTFDPDLVLAGRYTARASVALLERLGLTVVELDVAHSLEDVRGQIRTAARAMGVSEAGEQMIASLDTRIATAASPHDGERPLAAVFGPNGFTAGPRTLSGALMELAGFDNLAARAGIEHWGSLSLEQLLLARPRVLIVEAEERNTPALATQLLAHPALARLRDEATVVQVPRPLWSCPGPWIADALDRLTAARAAIRARPRR